MPNPTVPAMFKLIRMLGVSAATLVACIADDDTLTDAVSAAWSRPQPGTAQARPVFAGVYETQYTRRFRATSFGIHLGTFPTAEVAARAYDKFWRDKEQLRMNFAEMDIEIPAYKYARLGTRLAGDGHVVLLSVRTVIHDQNRRGTILHEIVVGEVGVALCRGWACRRLWGTY